MTDIEKLAREAGAAYMRTRGRVDGSSQDAWTFYPQHLEAFAQAVARRCAEICKEEAAGFARTASGHSNGQYDHMEDGATACDQSIRAEFGI